MTANPWLNYWQTLPAGNLLFAPEASEFVRNFITTIPVSQTMSVLDYGCGTGTVARLLAPSVKSIAFTDAAASMLGLATEQLADVTNASVWNGQGTFDLIIVNSVIQYLNSKSLQGLLAEWTPMLNPGGRIVLADLTPVGHRSAMDMLSLFRFSVRHGYFFTALRKTWAERRRYNATAMIAPLYRVDLDWLRQIAEQSGYRFERLPHNLTHFRNRVTVVLYR
jgi:trans-aconitate methyltransferase